MSERRRLQICCRVMFILLHTTRRTIHIWYIQINLLIFFSLPLSLLLFHSTIIMCVCVLTLWEKREQKKNTKTKSQSVFDHVYDGREHVYYVTTYHFQYTCIIINKLLELVRIYTVTQDNTINKSASTFVTAIRQRRQRQRRNDYGTVDDGDGDGDDRCYDVGMRIVERVRYYLVKLRLCAGQDVNLTKLNKI